MPTTKFRTAAARASLAVAACGGTLLLATGTASAAGLTSPAPGSTFTAPECTTGVNCDNDYQANTVGAPVAFNVNGTGFPVGSTVYLEICDGVSPSSPGWTPNAHCDAESSPASRTIGASNPNGNVSWGTGATNAAGFNEVGVFRGIGPSNQFNCLAPHDNPTSTSTQDGEQILPSAPSYTNCQVRLATSLQNVTGDQTFFTLAIPDAPATGPAPATPEVPYAILLPVGAAALLGGGLLLTRRRRNRQAAA